MTFHLNSVLWKIFAWYIIGCRFSVLAAPEFFDRFLVRFLIKTESVDRIFSCFSFKTEFEMVASERAENFRNDLSDVVCCCEKKQLIHLLWRMAFCGYVVIGHTTTTIMVPNCSYRTVLLHRSFFLAINRQELDCIVSFLSCAVWFEVRRIFTSLFWHLSVAIDKLYWWICSLTCGTVWTFKMPDA